MEMYRVVTITERGNWYSYCSRIW